MTEAFIWWKYGVVYQIYPRSFMDSNGDGVGDLQGIIDRLDYLVELGIDAVWISPIYPSPMADFGYDVANYVDIDPIFGDLATFDRLLDEAHTRGIKVILDYVPNHSSDEHPWFIESRSSQDNPKRDWYIWRDAKPDGGVPNNWESLFGGSAWEWDEPTQQYYLHLFDKKQVDLNWRNPEVVNAMHDVLRFWLDRGVDGFRMDVVTFLIKHPDFPDNPMRQNDAQAGMAPSAILEHTYDINQPEIHDYIRGIRAIFDAYDRHRVTIGETWFTDPHELATYYGKNFDELHIPFNFNLMKQPWHVQAMKKVIADYYAALPQGATPNFVLGSHDEHRLATRFGVENHRSAALLLLTLWGVPTLYYGDEIGMMDGDIPDEYIQDPWAVNNPGQGLGRDPERTPMQWNTTPSAGFSPDGVRTWLPVHSNYLSVNVETQRQDPTSTLHFYKQLLRLRRELPVLHRESTFQFLENVPSDVLAYTRHDENTRVLVAINFSDQPQTIHLVNNGTILLNTVQDRLQESFEAGNLLLRPHEGVLLQVH